MNDDLVVQKILKLLENNTAFIGYALNGGIGTKINVRNTETGKTIQALSINVDSSGEVLVVKDSDDGKYKAVTFKAAQQTTERIIQIRKTKPVDDKKTIEYTDSDIEVFYLFVKLIDTGSPVDTQLQSTWIRKGSSCTQFVGAYERCNYASKATIGGTSYTGLPYVPYPTLQDCLNDDLGRDAKTPHGSGDENGLGAGYKIYSTVMTAEAENNLRVALESHDSHYGTSYKKLFGYGSILECSGAMYIQGWEAVNADPTPEQLAAGESGTPFFRCEFSYLPGYTNECSSAQQTAGYCDSRGFIGSKAPLFGQEEPGQPSLNQVDNTWGHQYGWVNLPYEFMYKRHFPYNYLNGANAQGSFLILEVNDDQTPTIPDGYFPWTPGCPSNLGDGGPYNGGGGNRFPDGPPKIKKRDMKLSTHKAEIWLGSSRKETAIKLYELGASDLFSGMYNSFIIRADETRVDQFNRTRNQQFITVDDQFEHEKFYENWNKNIIDLRIDPRVWVYIKNNIPHAVYQYTYHALIDPQNDNLQNYVDSLYQRTLNLTVVDKKTQIIHLKLGLKPASNLSNTDCKSTISTGNERFSSQSWEYQKLVTIKIKDWGIESSTNTLSTSELVTSDVWNTNHISRKFLTSFGTFRTQLERDNITQVLSRHDNLTDFSEIISGNHFEQYNYAKANLDNIVSSFYAVLYSSNTRIFKPLNFADNQRFVALSTMSWWELWDKTHYNKKQKRLSSIVGYDLNNHQILRSSKLGLNLTYQGTTGDMHPPFSNAVIRESYFEYLPERPKLYTASAIRGVRNKLPDYPFSTTFLTSRKTTLDTTGLIFYFADWSSRWSENTYNALIFIPPPSNYYAGGTNLSTLLRSHWFRGASGNSSNFRYGNRRLDTRFWTNNLWAQFIYDGVIKVDIDSYRKVEFNLPSNPNQYIKYTSNYTYNNSEYNFSQQPQITTDIETVLSPGILDVTKQVTIKKPTNVELDPNMSFLVYLYPFVEVTKKTKEI